MLGVAAHGEVEGVPHDPIDAVAGKDGLLHISQIADERVEKVTDYLSEGQDVDVVVLDVDQRGLIKLSMKEVAHYAQSA